MSQFLGALVIVLVAAACVAIYNIVSAMLWLRKPGRKVAWVWPTSQGRRMRKAYTPNRENDTLIQVRGWSGAELDKIWRDFRKPYGLSKSHVQISEVAHDTRAITFPDDIFPAHLYYLVNYVRYPKHFDSAARSIGVLCRAVLTSAYGAPDVGLLGTRAEIYVPSNDIDYTFVYVRTEFGSVYQVSLVNLGWNMADDPRMPVEISGF